MPTLSGRFGPLFERHVIGLARAEQRDRLDAADDARHGELGRAIAAGGSEQLAPELERRIAEWQDKYLRLQAEFDNYRKRTLREKMELVERGGADVIKAMLPVADDMDRAVEAMAGSDDIEALRAELEII